MKQSDWAIWSLVAGVVGGMWHQIAKFGEPQPSATLTALAIPVLVGFIWAGAGGKRALLALGWAGGNVAWALVSLLPVFGEELTRSNLIGHAAWAVGYSSMVWVAWWTYRSPRRA